jgi:hypothetical protein
VYSRRMVDAEGAAGAPARADGGDANRLEERPIRGQTSLRIEDFKSAWFAQPQMRWLVLYGVAVVVFMPLMVWTSSPEGFEPTFLVPPLLIVALGFGVIKGRARWAQAALQGYGGGTVEYLFDANGFQLQAPGRESRVEWATLHRHLETKEAFLIYHTPQLLNVVPKRAFVTADQARLREELAARVQSGKRGGGVGRTVVVVLVLAIAYVVAWQFLFPAH